METGEITPAEALSVLGRVEALENRVEEIERLTARLDALESLVNGMSDALKAAFLYADKTGAAAAVDAAVAGAAQIRAGTPAV